jgi:hypothetical protein
VGNEKRIGFDPVALDLANECLWRGARAKAMQADGSPRLSDAIAEMLLQSHEGELNLLPARLAWKTGAVSGLFAGGGFEVRSDGKDGTIEEARVLSRVGNTCRVRSGSVLQVTSQGRPVPVSRPDMALWTCPGVVYK